MTSNTTCRPPTSQCASCRAAAPGHTFQWIITRAVLYWRFGIEMWIEASSRSQFSSHPDRLVSLPWCNLYRVSAGRLACVNEPMSKLKYTTYLTIALYDDVHWKWLSSVAQAGWPKEISWCEACRRYIACVGIIESCLWRSNGTSSSDFCRPAAELMHHEL